MANRKRTLLPIGIHLNAEAVHMVQLEQSESTVGVVSKAAKYFGPHAAVAEAAHDGHGSAGGPKDARYEEVREFIREKITLNGFRGHDAVISLPAEDLVIQHVRMAPMQPEELIAALPVELHGKLPFDTKDAVIRHIVAGTVSENNEAKQDVIALAAQREVVERHVATMAKLGLRIVGVGVEPCAMCYPYAFASSQAAAMADGPPSLMAVYLGSETTHVAIVRGQDTTFVKGVEIGISQLVEAMAKARNISVADAAALRNKWRESQSTGVSQEAVEAYNAGRRSLEPLIDEVESCMRYHASLARGARVDRIVFLGPEARDRALVRVVGAQLGVPCEVGDPLAGITEETGRRDAEPELAVALGLSLFNAQ